MPHEHRACSELMPSTSFLLPVSPTKPTAELRSCHICSYRSLECYNWSAKSFRPQGQKSSPSHRVSYLKVSQ
eukprot:307955-Chlamydomonas_euryale.AAC.4